MLVIPSKISEAEEFYSVSERDLIKLLEKYNYQIGIALAAYNAGMGNVNTWIERGIIKEDGSDLENIPYKETNMYVRKILNYYKIYKELYN